MLRRILHLGLVAALAATGIVALGGTVASGQTGPVGYTVGGQFDGISDCGFWSIDLTTGEATEISEPGAPIDCADGLTFAPDGTLYAYTNDPINGAFVDAELVTIDLATGAQTPIGSLPNVFVGSGGMTFDAAGNLWLYANSFDPGAEDCGITGGEACLWQVDPATAETTFVGVSDGPTVFGLTGDCTPEVLALTGSLINGPGSDTAIERVDTATAGLESVVALPETVFPQGLDFDAAGELWALAGQEMLGIGPMEVQNVDLSTGAVTHTQIVVGGDPFSGALAGLAISPISCPEPPPTPEPVVVVPTFTG
jgi:hypothetical protein